ncbi:MAG: ammonium transporter [Treponemataceae bacterium]
MRKIALSVIAFSAFIGFPLAAQSVVPAPAAVLSGGNTAWVLIATALVLFMTMPALGLFYGGLVRKKNVLSIMMQSFITIALVSFLWVTIGYSLAFSDTELIPGVLGDFKWAFFNGIGPADLSPYYISDSVGRIPHILYAMFQCMFAVITPALIIGAFAERMKFSSFLVFTVAWLLLIYIPLAHMVWSANGWLYKLGALDFAGGTVVHVNAGFAALATALYLGKRSFLKSFPPHNLPFAVIGAAMLWFGWFGFNGGSSLAADGLAASAVMTTNTAAATAALVWAVIDSFVNGKPTVLGVATGAVVGLVAITPAAGFVNVSGAIAIGAIASSICYFMVAFVKVKFGYDDSLDAFGCHGIGGLVGGMLTGVFADPAVWKAFGGSYAGSAYGNPKQLGIQAISVIVSIALAFLGSLLLLKIIDTIMGVRVDFKTEAIGLDITQHNERAYTVIE